MENWVTSPPTGIFPPRPIGQSQADEAGEQEEGRPVVEEATGEAGRLTHEAASTYSAMLATCTLGRLTEESSMDLRKKLQSAVGPEAGRANRRESRSGDILS